MSFNLTRNRIGGLGFRQQRFSVINPTTFTNKLQAYYKFNNTGLDSSRNGRDLTYTGTEAYATGILENGYSLPGNVANFATGPTDTVLDFAGGGAQYTISVWVNYNTVSGEQILLEKFVGGSGPGWTLTKLSNQAFQFFGQATTTAQTALSLATAGSFLHIVVRSDGSTTDIFFNGATSGTAGVGAISSTTNPLLVGERQGSGSFPLNGVIDEVALWSRGLTNDEILVLFNNGNGLALF